MLTTTSAIADVNFTEKTYFTSTQLKDWDNVYATYYNVTDDNGITITSSSTNSHNVANITLDNVVYKTAYSSDALDVTAYSYDEGYVQITSTEKAITRLSLLTRASNESYKTQTIIVGWKGYNTANANADYYSKNEFKDKDNPIKWITYDLSSWENVKTIRIYSAINKAITIDGIDLKIDAPDRRPYVFGIQVGIDTENISTSIGSYGVAAFSSASALDFTNVTECSAFYADSYDNGVLHLTKATGVVPAHFGLLLCSTNEGAVSFSIPIATAEQAAACTNKFVATDESTYTPTTSTEALALGVKNGKAGFYYVGAGVTVPQYRFYLPAPSVGGAKNLTLDFDNATGITSIPFNDPATQNSVGESAIPSQTTQPTDLLGRPCPTPRAGALYIKGGKAYLTPAR